MGALDGVRVVEVAGIGPGPFASMLLADHGAEVVRVTRSSSNSDEGMKPPMDRGRRAVTLPLKTVEGQEALLRLVEKADVILEGFRPGVMERLGLGPDECLARNPALVYGRMTGWGQSGPYAQTAGHDINYIALSGTLRNFARRGEAPMPPLNLVGDFGGGGFLLAFGVLAAMWESRRSGIGQVVDAAMVDGSALLMTMIHGMNAAGEWNPEPGTNYLDTGAPFYDVYRTSDGKYLSVGCMENQFFTEFVQLLDIDFDPVRQHDRETWPELRALITAKVAERTRDDWGRVFSDSDACVVPVLSLNEAPLNRHLAERGTFIEIDGVLQPAPAPRLSRTPAHVRTVFADEHPLVGWGFSPNEIAKLTGL